MGTQARYVLQAFWGVRSVTAEDVASRLSASLLALEEIGGDLAGPWLASYETEVDPRNVNGVRAVVDGSAITETDGTPRPEDGFTPTLTVGDWKVPQHQATEIGKLQISTQTRSLFSSAVLVLEGERLASQARGRGVELVQCFARSWQPDVVALTDTKLQGREAERLGISMAGFAPWGYISWLSDRFSRQLEFVEGASTSRFGPGTLLVADSWNDAATSQVWHALLDSRRLRQVRPDEIQELLPAF